jgi:hypothetical protein
MAQGNLGIEPETLKAIYGEMARIRGQVHLHLLADDGAGVHSCNHFPADHRA